MWGGFLLQSKWAKPGFYSYKHCVSTMNTGQWIVTSKFTWLSYLALIDPPVRWTWSILVCLGHVFMSLYKYMRQKYHIRVHYVVIFTCRMVLSKHYAKSNSSQLLKTGQIWWPSNLQRSPADPSFQQGIVCVLRTSWRKTAFSPRFATNDTLSRDRYTKRTSRKMWKGPMCILTSVVKENQIEDGATILQINTWYLNHGVFLLAHKNHFNGNLVAAQSF